MLPISPEKSRQLAALIQGAGRIAVVGHTHPDGDALGAVSALVLYLRQCCGKDAACVLPDTPGPSLHFLLSPDIPWHFLDQTPDAARQCIAQADLVFLLDCNAFHRTEGLQDALAASTAPKVLIDHHLNPDTASFNLVFSTPDVSSASELLYWVLKAGSEGVVPEIASASLRPLPNFAHCAAVGPSLLSGRGWPEIVGTTPSEPAMYNAPKGDAPEGASAFLSATEGASPSANSAGIKIGTALMAGMTTDTNNFANSVFPSTLQMASELLALGVDRDALLGKIYQSYRENRVRLMGYMQAEGLRILPCGGAFMILTEDIQRRFDMQEGESEGLVNVPLTIGAVRLSVLLREENGVFRVSVRSKKGTSAQQLAQRHFHGGGHENAAGGKLVVGEDIASAQEAPAFLEQTLNTFLA